MFKLICVYEFNCLALTAFDLLVFVVRFSYFYGQNLIFPSNMKIAKFVKTYIMDKTVENSNLYP